MKESERNGFSSLTPQACWKSEASQSQAAFIIAASVETFDIKLLGKTCLVSV